MAFFAVNVSVNSYFWERKKRLRKNFEILKKKNQVKMRMVVDQELAWVKINPNSIPRV